MTSGVLRPCVFAVPDDRIDERGFGGCDEVVGHWWPGRC